MIYELSKVLCVLELLFMKDLVLLRLKKIILMILLQAVMMLMKLFRELSVAFRKDTGLADALAYILQGSASRRVRKKFRLRRKMKD